MLNVVNLSKMAILGSLLLTGTCVHGIDLENNEMRFQDRSSKLSFQKKRENIESAYGYSYPYRVCYSPRLGSGFIYDQGSFYSTSSTEPRIALDYSMYQTLDGMVKKNMANVIREYKEIQPNFGLRPIENNPKSGTNQPVVESEFVRELKAKRKELKTRQHSSSSQEKVHTSPSSFDLRW